MRKGLLDLHATARLEAIASGKMAHINQYLIQDLIFPCWKHGGPFYTAIYSITPLHHFTIGVYLLPCGPVYFL